MKTWTFCIALSISVAAASTASAKPHKKRSLSAAKAADGIELPAEKGESSGKRASYWLAADPHVPLASIVDGAIRSVGKRGTECGAASRWAKPGSRWVAVDAWGQRSGVFEVKDSETFDVTTCHELRLSAASGKPGAGIFVSEDSGYKPGASAVHLATAAEKKRFEHFLGSMETTWVNHRPLGKAVPWGKRTMFFQFEAPRDPNQDGRVDGAGKPIERPRRWAVAGGPMLVVAYEGEHGNWKAATVNAPLGLADSYTPIAVFDMNGDGVPEIVVRASDGPNFADRVLALNPKTMAWEEAAESPGGAML